MSQARSIPWDCSDWQAFAHADRPTTILESLAENRGKTLYCGVDQSDTFTKAETWEAGRDRNERDDTVYFGERGQFRGFIAAQEGWLTEGESGVTGVSIDRIFEFPREKKKRRRYKTVVIEEMAVAADPSRLIYTPYGPLGDPHPQVGTALANARSEFATRPPAGWSPAAATASWQARAQTAATAHCAAAGYNRAVNVTSSAETWTYSSDQGSSGNLRYQARKSRQWAATCQKTKRRRLYRPSRAFLPSFPRNRESGIKHG